MSTGQVSEMGWPSPRLAVMWAGGSSWQTTSSLSVSRLADPMIAEVLSSSNRG